MKHIFLSILLIVSSALAVAQDSEALTSSNSIAYADNSTACNAQHIFSKTDVLANYQGGVKQLEEDINSHLTLDKKVAGTAYVYVIINCNDQAYSFNVLQGLDTETDQVLVETLGGLQNWTTGSQKGEKVDYSIGLHFKIKKGKVVDIEWPTY